MKNSIIANMKKIDEKSAAIESARSEWKQAEYNLKAGRIQIDEYQTYFIAYWNMVWSV